MCVCCTHLFYFFPQSSFVVVGLMIFLRFLVVFGRYLLVCCCTTCSVPHLNAGGHPVQATGHDMTVISTKTPRFPLARERAADSLL